MHYRKSNLMMLALPVERLVGGGSTSSRRMSLSPDTASDNDNSSSESSHSHHHPHPLHHNNCTASAKISSSPLPPLPSPPCSESDCCNCTATTQSPIASITTNRKRSRSPSPQQQQKIKHSPFSPSDDNVNNSPTIQSSPMTTITRVKVKSENEDMDERISKEYENSANDNSNCKFNFIRTSAADHRDSSDVELNVDGDEDEDEGPPSRPSHNNNNNNNNNNPIHNYLYRPPSVASNTSSISSSNLTCSSQKSPYGSCFVNTFTQNPTNRLKFSIEDILRPDFGGGKSIPLKNNRKWNKDMIMSPGSSLSRGGRTNTGSVSSTEGHRPYRPSSVCHSEDSNGSSCKREVEVVDDTKVNPPVPEGPLLWPAWVYCTRYSDRPSSGPRSRRIRKSPREIPEEKRPRTAFTGEQLARLKKEFEENRYLTEKRRQDLARDLKLHENQIKIWFQNKRAKLKKSTGTKNGLAMQLMAQGLYNHSTVPVDEDEDMMDMI